MRSALIDLALDHLLVVHAGTSPFHLAERIEAVSAAELLTSSAAAISKGWHGRRVR